MFYALGAGALTRFNLKCAKSLLTTSWEGEHFNLKYLSLSLFIFPFLVSIKISDTVPNFQSHWQFGSTVLSQWKRSYFLNIYMFCLHQFHTSESGLIHATVRKKSPLALAAQKCALPDFSYFSTFWLRNEIKIYLLGQHFG